MIRFASFVLVFVCICPSPVVGQQLTGRVLEEGRETPVRDAAVFLLDASGDRRSETASDSVGRFVLEVPAGTEFFLQVEHLGYETARTPLLTSGSGESPGIDILVRPIPLPLPGVNVSLDREAERFLGLFGHTPETLDERWIDRDEIEAMRTPGLPKDLLRRQNIAGLRVIEMDPVRDPRPSLCVTFRGRGCALTVLNGSVISRETAFYLDPRDLEAVAVLTPTDAMTFYGTRAAGGAVLMWTRTGGR